MKIYQNIDSLPLYNYSKVSEENELRYLLVLPDYFELPKISEKEMKQLFEVWEKINDEIIDFVGISSDFKQILRAKKSIALLKCRLIDTGDRSLETLIEIQERQLLNLYPKQKQNIDENIIAIELQLKMQIDIYKTSTKKYFSYIKFLTKNKAV